MIVSFSKSDIFSLNICKFLCTILLDLKKGPSFEKIKENKVLLDLIPNNLAKIKKK